MGAQVNEVLIDHVAARIDGCGLHRRSNPSPALPNSTLRTRSQTTPVSGEHAHAHRPIELAGVRAARRPYPVMSTCRRPRIGLTQVRWSHRSNTLALRAAAALERSLAACMQHES